MGGGEGRGQGAEQSSGTTPCRGSRGRLRLKLRSSCLSGATLIASLIIDSKVSTFFPHPILEQERAGKKKKNPSLPPTQEMRLSKKTIQFKVKSSGKPYVHPIPGLIFLAAAHRQNKAGVTQKRKRLVDAGREERRKAVKCDSRFAALGTAGCRLPRSEYGN